jgi:FtsH-binding integral membrane protein
MSNFDRNYAATSRGVGAGRAVAIDQGLRAYMIRVYNYMAMGVALTGAVAWLTFQMAGGDAIQRTPRGIVGVTPFGQLILSFPGQIVLFVALLGLVWFVSARIDRLQAATAFTVFMVFSALFGLLLSSVFVVYTGVSITRTFFISATAFGALSLYGYTTKRDLSPIGSFLIMGVWGIFLAGLANIYFQNSMLQFAISAIGVLCFAGLTAYDTQRIKEMYDVNDDGTVVGRKAVMGALSLYLDFINLFQFLLYFLGDRR